MIVYNLCNTVYCITCSKVLPLCYSYIGDQIDVLPEKEKTEYLKSKIKWKLIEKKVNYLKVTKILQY